MSELLPCPFCGGKAEALRTGDDLAYAGCSGCGMYTGELPHGQAIVSWNRRTQPQGVVVDLPEPELFVGMSLRTMESRHFYTPGMREKLGYTISPKDYVSVDTLRLWQAALAGGER